MDKGGRGKVTAGIAADWGSAATGSRERLNQSDGASELGITEAHAFARLFESRDGRDRELAKEYRTRP